MSASSEYVLHFVSHTEMLKLLGPKAPPYVPSCLHCIFFGVAVGGCPRIADPKGVDGRVVLCKDYAGIKLVHRLTNTIVNPEELVNAYDKQSPE